MYLRRCGPCMPWTTRTCSSSSHGRRRGEGGEGRKIIECGAAPRMGAWQHKANESRGLCASGPRREVRATHATSLSGAKSALCSVSLPPPHRYETTNHLWLILEYCVGGDLLSLLRQDVKLPETSVHDFARDLVVAMQVGWRGTLQSWWSLQLLPLLVGGCPSNSPRHTLTGALTRLAHPACCSPCSPPLPYTCTPTHSHPPLPLSPVPALQLHHLHRPEALQHPPG